ncbi:unnamed protein product, partial [Allacma fusca]
VEVEIVWEHQIEGLCGRRNRIEFKKLQLSQDPNMLGIINRSLISRCLLASIESNSYVGVSIKGLSVLTPSVSKFSTLSMKFLQPWNMSSGDCIPSSAPNQVATYVPSRGMKILGKVKRRCKDCQLVWKDGILYNFCKTRPRHKQMLKPQYWENQRIITHASSGNKRPW